MRGSNALSSDMLNNVIKGAEADYAPYTNYANAASKIAYSQFVGPQSIANILNNRVCVLDKEEGPSLGAAMLAAVGTGAYETVEAAAGQIVHVLDTIEPDAEIAARYEEKYRQFQQIYPALKPVFDSMAKCE